MRWAEGPDPLRLLLAGSASYLDGVVVSHEELGVPDERMGRLAFGVGDD